MESIHTFPEKCISCTQIVSDRPVNTRKVQISRVWISQNANHDHDHDRLLLSSGHFIDLCTIASLWVVFLTISFTTGLLEGSSDPSSEGGTNMGNSATRFFLLHLVTSILTAGPICDDIMSSTDWSQNHNCFSYFFSSDLMFWQGTHLLCWW